MSKPTLDHSNLPSDRLARKAEVFLTGVKERASESVTFIRQHYPRAALLDECCDFLDYRFIDAARGDLETLKRVWFFPFTETQMEFDNALTQALTASYKSGYDYLRRGLELTLVGVFLGSTHTDRQEARGWMLSRKDTPNFTRMLDAVSARERFNALARREGWKADLKAHYRTLCDVIHVKGTAQSFRELNRPGMSIDNTFVPEVVRETLVRLLDHFIETVRHVATLMALHNPILLVGVPLTEKFGMDIPISGFYEESESELFFDLLPDKYKGFFNEVRKNDPEVRSILEWFDAQPSLTREQYEQTVKDFGKSCGCGLPRSNKDKGDTSGESTATSGNHPRQQLPTV